MPHVDRTLNKTERLFAIVLLLQNRPNLSSRDLADHFGVSRRTIFRDLRALSESGVPLTYADEGGYEILEGYQLPPLMFSAREAATLLIGARFTRLQPDVSLKADADAVAMKIHSVLPETIREYIDRLEERTVIGPYLREEEPDEGLERDGHWYELSEAVARQRSVWMEYFVPSRDELTKRKINPLGLVYYSDSWNVVAFDHLRREVRNFRLDRIHRMRLLMDTFKRPPEFDLQQYLREKGSAPQTQVIDLTFSKSVFRWAHRSLPAEIDERHESEAGVRVTFHFDNIDYLARWLLRYGVEVMVHGPDELRMRLAEWARTVAQHHTSLS